MSWGKWVKEAKKLLTAKNVAAVAAAPFTAGASLAMLEDNSGRNIIDGLRGEADVEKQNQFNANQAQLNREFQAEMSNTAIQRARADAEAAGYNPVLGLANPASTPAGSTATSAGLPQSPGQAIGEIATSAMNLTQGLKNISENNWISDTKKAEIGKTVAETELTQAKTKMVTSEWQILSREDQIQQATLLDRYYSALNQANNQRKIQEITNEWLNTNWGKKMSKAGLTLGQIGQIISPIEHVATGAFNSGRSGLTINNF